MICKALSLSLVLFTFYTLHHPYCMLYIQCNQAAVSCMFNFPYLVSDKTKKHSNATF